MMLHRHDWYKDEVDKHSNEASMSYGFRNQVKMRCRKCDAIINGIRPVDTWSMKCNHSKETCVKVSSNPNTPSCTGHTWRCNRCGRERLQIVG